MAGKHLHGLSRKISPNLGPGEQRRWAGPPRKRYGFLDYLISRNLPLVMEPSWEGSDKCNYETKSNAFFFNRLLGIELQILETNLTEVITTVY